MTLLIRAFTDDPRAWHVPWKYHKTMPPLLKIVKRSNILIVLTGNSGQMLFLLYDAGISQRDCDISYNYYTQCVNRACPPAKNKMTSTGITYGCFIPIENYA